MAEAGRSTFEGSTAQDYARQHNGHVYNSTLWRDFEDLKVKLMDGADITYQQILQKERADESLQPAERNIVLLKAAKEGQLPRVRYLIHRLGVDLDCTNKRGQTATHMAAGAGFADVVRELIQAGADVNARARGGITPLDLAVAGSHLNVARVLFEFRADIDARFQTPNGPGMTPLHVAASRGSLEMTKLLIENGADLTAVFDDGYNALELAGKAVRTNEDAARKDEILETFQILLKSMPASYFMERMHLIEAATPAVEGNEPFRGQSESPIASSDVITKGPSSSPTNDVQANRALKAGEEVMEETSEPNRSRRTRDTSDHGSTHDRASRISRNLAWLLRHGAESENLSLGPQGYANVADVLNTRSLRYEGVTFGEVRRLMENDRKGRFAMVPACTSLRNTHKYQCKKSEDWKIRATGGHSLKIE